MNRKIIFFSIFLYPALLMSQEKLNSLTAPSSPASSILGLQPTTILSPKSYQTLETAIFSNFINNFNPTVPNDFALEFTPYWATNHGISLEDYLDPKIGVKQFIRNFSFSLASTQNFILGDSTSTNGLAFGYRTTLYFSNKSDREIIQQHEAKSDRREWIYGQLTKKAENLGDDINVKNKADFLKEIKSTILDAFRKYENEEESKKLTNQILMESESLPELDKTKISVFVEGFRNLVDNNLKGDILFNEYKAYIRERQGLEIDFAYANLLNFPTNSFEYSYLPRQSFWITPTYRFKDKLTFLKVLGVFRYEWYNLDYYKIYFPDINIYKNNLDFGFALSSEFEKVSIQFELVGRNSNSEIPSGTDNNGNELFRKDQKSDFQYIGTFNYNITDQIIISYNIGNRFDPIQNPNNTLVSSLSLNLGFGTPNRDNIK